MLEVLVMRRVGIIGTGLVGATCGYALITQNVCQEILLIDINQERAQGEMLDLMNSVQFMSQRTKVRVARYHYFYSRSRTEKRPDTT